MSALRKRTSRDELRRIEDALVESILSSTMTEVVEEMRASGGDPDQCFAELDSAIVRARAACARQKLETARTELAAWRTRTASATSQERAAARARFDRLRAGETEAGSEMMLAARNGKGGPSDKDIDAVLDDMAELERLEREDAEE